LYCAVQTGLGSRQNAIKIEKVRVARKRMAQRVHEIT
jgi:hypothetical protein